jgi:TP901 family phage tail tape measure protein
MNDQYKLILEAAYNLSNANKKLKSDIEKVKNDVKLKFDVDIDDKTAKQSINNVKKDYVNLWKSALKEQDNYKKQSKQLEQQESKMWSNRRKESVASITATNTELKKMAQYYRDLEKENQAAIGLNFGKTTLNNQITTYLKENTKLSSDFKNQLIDIQGRLKNVDVTGLRNARKEFSNLKSEATALGQTGKSALGNFTADLKNFITFLGAGTLIMGGVNAVRSMIDAVKDLDKAFISLRKVTDETDEVYKRFLQTATNNAKALGSNISDIVEMTATWAKLGYEIEQASQLAEVSTVYANVAEITDTSKAVGDLVTAMKAYNIESTDAIKIADSLNNLGNKYATDAASLGEGLSNAASALALAGNDINESLALITGGTEITQNASEMGNALKVLSMRLRGMKGELQAIGEEYENIESVSKIQTQIYNLTDGVVNIMDELDPTKFKSTYEIIKDIAGVWDQLAQTDQAALLETIAGKQRGNSIAALIQSFQSGQAQKALEDSINSVGSAMAEQQKYMEGIEYSADRLKASFQELASTTINSEWVKGFLDVSNIIVNITTSIGGLIPVLGTLAGAFTANKLLLPVIVKSMGNLLLANTGVTASTMSQIVAQTGLNGALSLGATAAKGLISSIAPLLGIGAIIAGTVMAYDALNVSLTEQKEITKNLESEYSELQTELSSIETELSTVGDKIDELNDKDNLTLVEQGELEKLKETNDLLETQKRLLEEQALIKQREIADSVATEFSKDFTNNNTERTYWTGGTTQVASRGEAVTVKEFITTSEEDYAKNMIDLIEQYNEKRKQGVELSEEEKSYYEEIRKELVDIGVKYVDYADRYKIDDETSQSWRDFATLIDKTLNPESYQIKEFDEIYNSEQFSNAKKELEKLARAGELTPEVLSSTAEYKKLLEETGFSAEEVASHINAISVESNDVKTNGIIEVNTALSDLEETINELPSKLADIEEMQDNLNDSYSYSYDEIEELRKKYPELESAIYRTADGWAIEKEAVDLLYGSVTDLSTQFQNAEALMTDFVASETAKRLEAYGIEIKTLQDLANFRAGDEMRKQQELGIGKQSLSTMNPELWAEIQSYQSALTNLESLKGRLSDITGGGTSGGSIGSVRGTQKTNASKSSKETKESTFSNQIDWSKESVDKLNKAVSDFSSTLDDSNPYSKQIEDLKTLISLQKSLEKGYKEQAKTYKTEFDDAIKGLDKKYVDRIKNGGSFSIQDFEGLSKGAQEQLYNQITSALSIYKQWQDALDSANDTTIKIAENTEKLADIKLNASFEEFDKAINNINKTLSETDKLTKYFDDGSVEQIILLQTGYEQASEKTKQLNDEIAKLNKKFAKGKIEPKDYTERLEDLTSQLYDSSSAMKSYQDSIISNMKKRYDDQKDMIEDTLKTELDAIETARKATIDALNDQIKKYKDIVDARKKALRDEQETDNYNEEVAEYNSSISAMESRLELLNRAVRDGDRSAIKEKTELEKQLDDEKKALAKLQKDREVDLAEDALDESYNAYEEMMNKQISDMESYYDGEKTKVQQVHDDKMSKINLLYETEKNFIIEAANLTATEFSKAFDSINATLSQYGLSMSSDLANVYSSTGSSVSGISKVSSILGQSGSNNADTSGLSQLNQYLGSKGYNTITKKQMVEIAQALGLTDIDGVEDVQDTTDGRVNINRILEALKKASFTTGGMILEDGIRLSGEDKAVFVKNREIILNQTDSKTFQQFIPLMKNIVQQFKPNYPDFTKLATSNNTPVFNFDNMINITGTVTGVNAANQIRSASDDVINKINNAYRQVK